MEKCVLGPSILVVTKAGTRSLYAQVMELRSKIIGVVIQKKNAWTIINYSE